MKKKQSSTVAPGTRTAALERQDQAVRRAGGVSCRRPLLAVLLLASWVAAQAQNDEPPPADLLEIPQAAPEPPPPVRSGEPLEPEVQIILREKETVTEYRVNGRLRAIKVVPVAGPAYYLVDTDGDGSLETRGELDGDLLIPHWVIFSW
ncbi:MAG: DUF2782 domain-containing protein [Gammaproteobacteria bacterium]